MHDIPLLPHMREAAKDPTAAEIHLTNLWIHPTKLFAGSNHNFVRMCNNCTVLVTHSNYPKALVSNGDS
jgi:hypothetical protein